jgi:hypothetical protein
MITNFEQITSELSESEMMLIKPLILGLKTKTKENPIKAPDIIKSMNEFADKKGLVKMTGARLRKCINYIRSNSLLAVIGTSQGYYVSQDRLEIEKQIKSLIERSNSILNCVRGLERLKR